jgi:hypothetical protein
MLRLRMGLRVLLGARLLANLRLRRALSAMMRGRGVSIIARRGRWMRRV